VEGGCERWGEDRRRERAGVDAAWTRGWQVGADAAQSTAQGVESITHTTCGGGLWGLRCTALIRQRSEVTHNTWVGVGVSLTTRGWVWVCSSRGTAPWPTCGRAWGCA
jgi:hypothetical protein